MTDRPRTDGHALRAVDIDRLLQAGTTDDPAGAATVRHFTRRIHAVARAHRLRAHEAEDVVQTTWLRFLEHRDRIRDPRAVGAWLQTTARRESLRALRDGARVMAVEGQLDVRDPTRTPHERAEDRQCLEALTSAIRALPERQAALMAALLVDPERSYADVALELEMPIGSIGPTRARCLERLRRDPKLARMAGRPGLR